MNNMIVSLVCGFYLHSGVLWFLKICCWWCLQTLVSRRLSDLWICIMGWKFVLVFPREQCAQVSYERSIFNFWDKRNQPGGTCCGGYSWILLLCLYGYHMVFVIRIRTYPTILRLRGLYL
jgi:hypothetical protein